MVTCKICQHNFSTKSALNRHEKTAKYCLAMRSGETMKNGNVYECSACQKEFSSNYLIRRHQTMCKVQKGLKLGENMVKILKRQVVKLENELMKGKGREDQKDQQISRLEKQVKDLQNNLLMLARDIARDAIRKPTTQINTRIDNQVNNLLPLTDAHIEEQIPNLTIDHIKRGAKGYADYALEYTFKDRIKCTDFSRRKVKYKDSDGNIVEDPDMIKLSKKFFKAIEEHNTTLTNQYGKELYSKLTNILQNSGDELSQDECDDLQLKQQRILQELSIINSSRIDVTDIANGKRSEFLPDFVKEVCATTV